MSAPKPAIINLTSNDIKTGKEIGGNLLTGWELLFATIKDKSWSKMEEVVTIDGKHPYEWALQNWNTGGKNLFLWAISRNREMVEANPNFFDQAKKKFNRSATESVLLTNPILWAKQFNRPVENRDPIDWAFDQGTTTIYFSDTDEDIPLAIAAALYNKPGIEDPIESAINIGRNIVYVPRLETDVPLIIAAAIYGVLIKGENPIVWAIGRNKNIYVPKIGYVDPIIAAAIYGQKIYDRDPIAWAIKPIKTRIKTIHISEVYGDADPIIVAAMFNLRIEGKDPFIWAIDNNIMIHTSDLGDIHPILAAERYGLEICEKKGFCENPFDWNDRKKREDSKNKNLIDTSRYPEFSKTYPYIKAAKFDELLYYYLYYYKSKDPQRPASLTTTRLIQGLEKWRKHLWVGCDINACKWWKNNDERQKNIFWVHLYLRRVDSLVSKLRAVQSITRSLGWAGIILGIKTLINLLSGGKFFKAAAYEYKSIPQTATTDIINQVSEFLKTFNQWGPKPLFPEPQSPEPQQPEPSVFEAPKIKQPAQQRRRPVTPGPSGQQVTRQRRQSM